MKTSDFEYNLPKKFIAQKALKKRDNAGLMVVNNRIEHKKFYDIIDYLEKGDVLVINETKVVNAKLSGKKTTGAPAEIIVEKKCPDYYECRVNSNKLRIGTTIELKGGLKAEIIGRNEDLFHLKFNKKVENILKKSGKLPHPTYIKRQVTEKEYQTVYATKPGSVAAPTAGLHFTKELLKKIRKKGIKIAKICLHIGFGTFIPIAEEDFSKHKMHSEFFEINKEAADKINNCKGRLIAAGTTSLRAIESAKYKNKKIIPCSGCTELFIKPSYKFKSKTSMMITNFHLPRSTLLLLVCAFAGRKKILKAYEEAVKKRYRFYSLGDAMLLFKENSHPQ